MHVVVDACGSTQVWTLLGRFHLAALAQFAGGENSDGLCFAYTVVFAELADGHLA